METRKCPLSEEGNEDQNQQHEGVDGGRSSGEDVKRKRAKCPQTAKKANVGNARDQARASIAES